MCVYVFVCVSVFKTVCVAVETVSWNCDASVERSITNGENRIDRTVRCVVIFILPATLNYVAILHKRVRDSRMVSVSVSLCVCCLSCMESESAVLGMLLLYCVS